MKKVQPNVFKGIIIAAGVLSIFLSVLILGLGLWEAYGNVKQNIFMVTVPGFHHLKFQSAGPYMGIYQHNDKGPMPLKILTAMEYRLISQDGSREIPIATNKNGDVITRMGQQAVPALSFIVDQAGDYTMSAFYLGEQADVPEMPIVIFGQGAQGMKQTLVIAGIFCALFVGLGLYLLVRSRGIGTIPLQKSPPKKVV